MTILVVNFFLMLKIFINLWAPMNTFLFYETGEIKIICIHGVKSC
jgi:hypothetical protein